MSTKRIISHSLAAACIFALCANAVLGATNGTDTAANYGGTWATGSNGNPTSFTNWNLTTSGSGNDGFFIGSSANGGGANIDTSGSSFGMYANNNSNSASYANRAFTSALVAGQTFSFTVTDNYTDGGHGVNLYDSSGTTLITYTHAGNGYVLGGTNYEGSYAAGTAVTLSFTQTTLSGGTYTITGSGGENFSGSGSYSGDINAFQLFTYNNFNGAQGDFYANSFTLSGVPEPSTWLAGGLIFGFAGFQIRRRLTTAR